MNQYEEDRALKLAVRALRHAANGKHALAAEAVQLISDKYGGAGLEYAFRAWIDTLATRLGITGDKPVKVSWYETTTGTKGTADDVPPVIRWAGQLINARFTLDIDTYEALLGALPEDPKAIGDYVLALLTSVATTLTQPQPA